MIGREWMVGLVCMTVGFLLGADLGWSALKRKLEIEIHDVQHFTADNKLSSANLRLRVVEILHRGDVETALRTECNILRSEIKHIEPADFDDRVDKTREFLQRAQAKVAELEKADRCGSKSTQ